MQDQEVKKSLTRSIEIENKLRYINSPMVEKSSMFRTMNKALEYDNFLRKSFIDTSTLSAMISANNVISKITIPANIGLFGVQNTSKIINNMITSLEKSIIRVSDINAITQNSISTFLKTSIPNIIGASQISPNKLLSTYLNMTKSYSSLINSIVEKTPTYITLSLIEKPAEEVFIATRLIETISSDEKNEELDDNKKLFSNELITTTEERLELLLEKLNKKFIPLLRGARSVLYSDNPDKIRHYMISARELLTHVLHNLAPDEEVNKWCTNPEFIVEGRPTRKARLYYICKDLNELEDFLGKDIKAMIGVFDFLNRGTHKLEMALTPNMLKIINLRFESALQFLLEIKFMQ